MDPRDAEVVAIMVRQVAKFERMVADLLEMARLEAGVGDLRLEVQDLGALLERVVHQVDPVPAVVVDPWWQGREVLVDKRRIERIVVNLVENARIHAGGATEVRLEGRFPAAVISVADAGPGVGETDRTRIFERFARGAGSQDRPGSGLGLALVAEHVRLLGGTVEVRNRPEGGACFVVTVPVDVEVRG
jgi:signal transduction histidine kinase